VHIVGGTIPGSLLAAAHASESKTDRSSSIPGTRIFRDQFTVAPAALSAA
jgi:hypothetical protein